MANTNHSQISIAYPTKFWITHTHSNKFPTHIHHSISFTQVLNKFHHKISCLTRISLPTHTHSLILNPSLYNPNEFIQLLQTITHNTKKHPPKFHTAKSEHHPVTFKTFTKVLLLNQLEFRIETLTD